MQTVNTAPIGRLGYDNNHAVVLTAAVGTPAAATPATLTGSRTVLSEGYNPSLLFNSRLRQVPVRLRFLPTESGTPTTTRWFSLT